MRGEKGKRQDGAHFRGDNAKWINGGIKSAILTDGSKWTHWWTKGRSTCLQKALEKPDSPHRQKKAWATLELRGIQRQKLPNSFSKCWEKTWHFTKHSLLPVSLRIQSNHILAQSPPKCGLRDNSSHFRWSAGCNYFVFLHCPAIKCHTRCWLQPLLYQIQARFIFHRERLG